MRYSKHVGLASADQIKDYDHSGVQLHTLRVFIAVLLLSTLLPAQDTFDRVCVTCHVEKKISLRKTFMNALLVYSGKENMKAGLKYFLRHPRRDSSVMGEAFLDTHGLAKPLTIDDATLDKALDIYWKRYTVQGNLH